MSINYKKNENPSEENVKRGKYARAKGARLQYKSRDYVLANIEKYGVPPTVVKDSKGKEKFDRFLIAGMGFSGDFFGGRWDIVALPDDRAMINNSNPRVLNYPTTLIQVKSATSFKIMPGKRSMKDNEYAIWLANFAVPTHIRKELHIWDYRAKRPTIINLDQQPEFYEP